MIQPDTNSITPTTVPSVRAVPSGAASWVTPELIEHTVRVWQPYYKEPLTPEDALAIIQSASQIFKTLSREPQP